MGTQQGLTGEIFRYKVTPRRWFLTWVLVPSCSGREGRAAAVCYRLCAGSRGLGPRALFQGASGSGHPPLCLLSLPRVFPRLHLPDVCLGPHASRLTPFWKPMECAGDRHC